MTPARGMFFQPETRGRSRGGDLPGLSCIVKWGDDSETAVAGATDNSLFDSNKKQNKIK